MPFFFFRVRFFFVCSFPLLHQHGDADIGNVDSEFTREAPKDTPVDASSKLSTTAASTQFAGFTYNPQSKLADD
jgi:hypothetical protein